MDAGAQNTASVAQRLERFHAEHVLACTRCPLHEGRTQVVAGGGSPTARLMFVGEAPGYHEDRTGVPFVGQAGQLLERLLAGIGLTRDDVFIANVLKCRPPGNRDPLPAEIRACEPHLFQQVAIIRPAMICTLGNFATKLLSGRADGISRVHGCELPIEVGGQPTLLYPLFHPAAALYTPAMLATLEADFARIPALIAGADGVEALAVPRVPAPPPSVEPPAPPPEPAAPPTEQLGLF
ncbi:MAG: uracil-DNA glycosylase [Thermoleophilia bacterium]